MAQGSRREVSRPGSGDVTDGGRLRPCRLLFALVTIAVLALLGPGAGSAAAEVEGAPSSTSTPAFPQLSLEPEDIGLVVDGVAYPLLAIQGHLDFTRRQALAAGDARGFYEWGEIIHLYDTAAERVLAARAAWDAGFRVTPQDRVDFAAHTVDGAPGYLEELYGGWRSVFDWDADLQILMKKWMVYVTHGDRDVSWTRAGTLMSADRAEFEAWDAWYLPVRRIAVLVAYPERLERGGEAAPRFGVVLVVFAGAAMLGVWLRSLARGPGGGNLLVRRPWIDGLVRRRIYPEGVQIGVLAVFLLMMWALALGPSLSHRNLGSVYLWILWWPLVPFLLFFSARSWCAVCPIATLGDLAQRVPGFGRRRTPRWLAVSGIWVIEGTFLAITWFDRSVGLVDSVRLTFTALLLLTGLALTVSVVYRRRTFCRHLCFFGALAGNYSMASVVELRPDGPTCRGCAREACLRDEAASLPDACPMLERPRALAENRECNFCLKCLRTCERRSLALRVRHPLRELATVRNPKMAVAGLAAVLVGVVAVQNLGMLQAAGTLERWLSDTTGLGRQAQASVIYLTALLLPLALLLLAARGDMTRAALFGYALIPLDLGAHAAHNLLHMLGEGKSVWWVTARLLGLSSPLDIPGGHPGGSMGAALLDAPTIKVLQISLLLLAAWGSFAVARRMRGRLGDLGSTLPLYGLLLVLLGLNLWLFSVPMALRH